MFQGIICNAPVEKELRKKELHMECNVKSKPKGGIFGIGGEVLQGVEPVWVESEAFL